MPAIVFIIKMIQLHSQSKDFLLTVEGAHLIFLAETKISNVVRIQ